MGTLAQAFPALTLSFTYVSKERDGSYEAVLAKRLSSLPGNAEESTSITTKQGRILNVWSALDEAGAGQLVAFVLQEGACFVKLSLDSHAEKMTSPMKRVFADFVASYEGNP